MTTKMVEGADHVRLPSVFFITAGPSSRAVQGVGLRPLAGWGCGFESRRGLVSFERCVLSGRGLFVGPEESYWVCFNVTMEPQQWEGPGPLGVVAPWGKKSFIAAKCNYAEKRRIMLSYVVKFVPRIWYNGSSKYITCLLKCLSTYCLWRNPQYVFSYPEDHLG